MSTLFYSEAAYNEAMEEAQAAPYGGYGNAMAQEMASQHARGQACSFDCATCDMGDWEADQEAEWEAMTPAERLAMEVESAEYAAYNEAESRRYSAQWAEAGFAEPLF